MVLERREISEGFRLRPLGLEGDGVVLENGHLTVELRDGHTPVGRIPTFHQSRVIPGRHQEVR